MRFLIDDSADARIKRYLVSRGFEANLSSEYGRSLPDVEILRIAHAETRVLITDDRDFGELVFKHKQPHSGVLYFRLKDTLLETRIRRLESVLERTVDDIKDFLVITDFDVRTREPPE